MRGAAFASITFLLAWPGHAQTSEVLATRGEWTQIVSAAVAGLGDRAPRYGGRIDGFMQIDGEKAGLWKGVSFELHGEFVYGKNVNRVGSLLLLPVNTALNFPRSNSEAADVSFSVVQKIGRARIQAGKINLLEQSTAIPVVGGGGKDGFQHIGLASPPALLASPKVFGALLSAPAGRLRLGLGIWTPEDWTQRYVPDGLFENGVNAMFVATLPAKIGGQQGFHTLSLFLTSRKSKLGESFPDLRPPPGLEGVATPAAGGAHVKYTVQQFLWRDPANPKRSWGFFGHFGASRGTPDILGWSMTAGFTGSGPIATRPDDRLGIGYFRFSLTPRVENALTEILPVRDEQGAELYYTAQVSPHLRLTANAQLVDPVIKEAPPAAFVGLRAKVDF